MLYWSRPEWNCSPKVPFLAKARGNARRSLQPVARQPKVRRGLVWVAAAWRRDGGSSGLCRPQRGGRPLALKVEKSVCFICFINIGKTSSELGCNNCRDQQQISFWCPAIDVQWCTIISTKPIVTYVPVVCCLVSCICAQQCCLGLCLGSFHSLKTDSKLERLLFIFKISWPGVFQNVFSSWNKTLPLLSISSSWAFYKG